MSARLHTLSNGVRVVADPMPGLESFALSVVVRGGARWEPSERNGWSHLLEHMVFKGAGERSAQAIVETVEADGGRVTDFPVSGLTDGRYAVTVQSSVPVAAAVRTVSGAAEGGATDFAWLPASGTLTRDALVSVPAGPAPLLHVRNPGDAEATVTARPTLR